MSKDATLIVMAAGMGSRFGGLKQLEPIGPGGEVILDFSVYDAIKAGFNKVVFIIRKDIEQDFKELVGNRIEKKVKTEYVIQEMENIPEGFSVPDGRTKPWGTAHAVFCCKDVVDTPFAVINADDYYGPGAFKTIYEELISSDNTCMVGYKLGNTLTENGTVARGVCEVSDGLLKGITEHTAIDKNSGVPLDTTVSMNMWGFRPSIFKRIEEDFVLFLENMTNPAKDEFYIPLVVDRSIKVFDEKIVVLDTDEKWYGVTYREDKESVVNAIKKLFAEGLYDGI
ncbi:MAG: nucleotidyltransferase [Ruminococcaceae bacterium]|nr:nucleotidyltransferase [Oscillospiraceae bacterium]